MTENQSHLYRFVYSVRFIGNKKAYTFGTNDNSYKSDEHVVVETARGLELGQVISEPHMTENVNIQTELKPILRKASVHDEHHYQDNLIQAKEALKTCQNTVARLKLDMNLISAEYTLDRAKVIFVYVADERVDFRELLKELAGQLKCRIDLRQIGPRDKAKIVGGLGPCGMETCCARFLNDFDVVSINMAKNQMLALNIQKLSGQCGKLMCCLKYEDELYKGMKAGCPKLNEQIEYKGKKYRVSSMNLITRLAKLENREEVLFLDFNEAFKNYTKKEVRENETATELPE